jgi:hypothetical protein
MSRLICGAPSAARRPTLTPRRSATECQTRLVPIGIVKASNLVLSLLFTSPVRTCTKMAVTASARSNGRSARRTQSICPFGWRGASPCRIFTWDNSTEQSWAWGFVHSARFRLQNARARRCGVVLRFESTLLAGPGGAPSQKTRRNSRAARPFKRHSSIRVTSLRLGPQSRRCRQNRSDPPLVEVLAQPLSAFARLARHRSPGWRSSNGSSRGAHP